VLLALAAAVQAGERLTMGYTAADGTTSVRRVEPHRLVPLRRNWYLLAHDLDRADWRIFRVDRAGSAVPDGSRFRHREPPAADVAGYVRGRIDTAAWGHEVRAVLRCPADRARGRLGGWARVGELTDRTCEVRMTTDALDWAAFALGRVGCEFGEVEPPELADLLRGWSERFGRAVGG
jgi:predicted DNA-binding transcriptional regulator YafY